MVAVAVRACPLMLPASVHRLCVTLRFFRYDPELCDVVRASEKAGPASTASTPTQPFTSPPLSAAVQIAAIPAQMSQRPITEMKVVDHVAELPSIPGSTEPPSIPNTPIEKL